MICSRRNEPGEIQQRIITAVRCMGDKSALRLWNIIYRDFNDYARIALIPSDEPDKLDIEMLRDTEENPDEEYYSLEEVTADLLGSGVNEDRTA